MRIKLKETVTVSTSYGDWCIDKSPVSDCNEIGKDKNEKEKISVTLAGYLELFFFRDFSAFFIWLFGWVNILLKHYLFFHISLIVS